MTLKKSSMIGKKLRRDQKRKKKVVLLELPLRVLCNKLICSNYDMYLHARIDLPSFTERELRRNLWTDLVEPSEQLISRSRNFPFSRNLTYR